MSHSFSGKVILITGGSASTGEASAKHFARLGASIVITGRDKKNLEKVAAECRSIGAAQVSAIIAEFSKQEDIKKVIDEIVKKFARLDVLVNNVGTVRDGTLCEVSMSDFDYNFNINVKSILYMTQLAMPHLVETKGCIVNVSSRSSVSKTARTMLYGMTKAALDHFTKTVALEYAPKGVHVNSVNPGYVRTKLNRSYGMSDEESDEFYKKADKMYPLGRCGTAEEVAEAIVFLASDTSAWTTGQCLFLDGGRTLMAGGVQ